MPALINIRPEAVNLDFYPGNPVVLTVNFPAGYLATRTIKSFLGGRASPGVEGTCVEATDTLTITFTGAQTTAVTTSIDGAMVWEMDLFTSGTPDVYEVLLTGIWSPGTDGSAGPTTSTFTVEIAPSVTVTVQAVAVTSGLPTGGTDGQVLTKTSATDYAVAWEAIPVGTSLSDVLGNYTAAVSVDATATPTAISSFSVTNAADTMSAEVQAYTDDTPVAALNFNLNGVAALILEHDNVNPLIGMFGAAATGQSAAIADAAGGATVDTEARAALNTLLAYLRLRGDIAT